MQKGAWSVLRAFAQKGARSIAFVEGKTWMSTSTMFDQIVGYAVVYSFICAQRHPNNNAMVPAICFAGECCVAFHLESSSTLPHQ